MHKKKSKEKPFNYKVLQPLHEEKSQLSLAKVYAGIYQAGKGYLHYSIDLNSFIVCRRRGKRRRIQNTKRLGNCL